MELAAIFGVIWTISVLLFFYSGSLGIPVSVMSLYFSSLSLLKIFPYPRPFIIPWHLLCSWQFSCSTQQRPSDMRPDFGCWEFLEELHQLPFFMLASLISGWLIRFHKSYIFLIQNYKKLCNAIFFSLIPWPQPLPTFIIYFVSTHRIPRKMVKSNVWVYWKGSCQNTFIGNWHEAIDTDTCIKYNWTRSVVSCLPAW